MFGYVIANPGALAPEELRRYKGCYCGLCRALGDRGGLCRLTLTYDLAFLALLLASLYEPAETAGARRCPRHPLKKQEYWRSEATDYAAGMNVLLSYEKLLDDWRDDGKQTARLMASALRRQAERAADQWPRQASAVRENLRRLSELERDGVRDVDRAGACFGALMAELFDWKGDRWSPRLRALGDGLGRYIYTLDAVLDLPGDREKGRYNPLLDLAGEDAAPEAFRPALMMLLGDGAAAFEELPLVRDVNILRAVLYSGVWTQFPKEGGPS